jgi:adenosine deaminase
MPSTTIETHPFKQMVQEKLAVSLCSDNMTVSNTNVQKEIRIAVDTFDLNAQELKDIVITGFKRSFMHGEYAAKRSYNRDIIDYYEKIEKEFGIEILKSEI